MNVRNISVLTLSMVLWQCSHWDHLRRVPPSRCPLVNRLGWGPEGVDLVRVKQCAHIREQLCKVQAGRNYSRPEPFDPWARTIWILTLLVGRA